MSALATWWLALAGWSVVVALWHTSVIALAFATWRLWRRPWSAQAQYVAASAALALAVVLTLATPFALRLPLPLRPVPTAAPAFSVYTRPLAVLPVGAAVPGTDARTTAARVAARAVPWLGALWGVRVAIALARLAGGWGLALWSRRRATRVDAPHLVDAVADVSAPWGLPTAALLASAHVDAPVVIGARAPAILLPMDLGQHLAPETVPPLLAHELAHVRRRDYASNLMQSVADALLWFSPGARFLSRSVREAREYCCDDVVAAGCGAGAYAAALTTLAASPSATTPIAVSFVGEQLVRQSSSKPSSRPVVASAVSHDSATTGVWPFDPSGSKPRSCEEGPRVSSLETSDPSKFTQGEQPLLRSTCCRPPTPCRRAARDGRT